MVAFVNTFLDFLKYTSPGEGKAEAACVRRTSGIGLRVIWGADAGLGVIFELLTGFAKAGITRLFAVCSVVGRQQRLTKSRTGSRSNWLRSFQSVLTNARVSWPRGMVPPILPVISSSAVRRVGEIAVVIWMNHLVAAYWGRSNI